MKSGGLVVVAGLGEIGKPLLQLISEHYDTVGVDIAPAPRVDNVEVLHICYPFQIDDFVAETTRYIQLFRPTLTIVHSTVAVGTTRRVAERSGSLVVNSPVRGKHARMLEELRGYVKFIGPMSRDAGTLAERHLQSLGLRTTVLSSPEATELAKLTETTYFGVLLAWAQQVERYCDVAGLEYDEVVSFFEEIKYLPQVRYFPGIIGGHCVLPNIEILNSYHRSALLDAISLSNKMKVERERQKAETLSAAVV